MSVWVKPGNMSYIIHYRQLIYLDETRSWSKNRRAFWGVEVYTLIAVDRNLRSLMTPLWFCWVLVNADIDLQYWWCTAAVCPCCTFWKYNHSRGIIGMLTSPGLVGCGRWWCVSWIGSYKEADREIHTCCSNKQKRQRLFSEAARYVAKVQGTVIMEKCGRVSSWRSCLWCEHLVWRRWYVGHGLLYVSPSCHGPVRQHPFVPVSCDTIYYE